MTFETEIILNLSALNLDSVDHLLTEDEIKQTWKQYAKLFHSDVQRAVDDGMIKKINVAKDFLIGNLDKVNEYITQNNPKLKYEAEQKKQKEREEQERVRAEQEKAERAKREEEEKKKRATEERKRKQQEEKRAKERAEQEVRRKEYEERMRKEAEEYRKKEEEERKRKAKEEEERFLNSITPLARRKYKSLKSQVDKLHFRNNYFKKRKKTAIITISATVAVAIFAVILVFTLIIPSNNYKKGMDAYENGQYELALEYLEKAGSYSDAEKYALLSNVRIYENNGDYISASVVYGQMDDAECYQKSLELYWDTFFTQEVATMGTSYVAVVKKDGTVGYKYMGDNDWDDKTEEIETWENIKYIAGSDTIIVGVTNEGKLKITGHYPSNPEKLIKKTKDWYNIVAVYVCGENIIGQKADGTILTTSSDGVFADVKKWTGVKDIDVASYEYSDVYDTHTGYLVGAVMMDGTVKLASTSDEYISTEIRNQTQEWKDVVQISVSSARWIGTHVVGLSSSGKVYACGTDTNNVCDVDDWENVNYIHSTSTYTFGITEEGSVLLVGSDAFSRKDVSNIYDAKYMVNIENLLVIDDSGNFQWENNGKTSFFDEWSGYVLVPTVITPPAHPQAESK